MLDHCPACGTVLSEKRPAPHQRKVFAVIAEAFDQRPEGHEFLPRDTGQLRAHLLFKAGYQDREIIEFGQTASLNDCLADAPTKPFARERGKGADGFVRPAYNGVAMHRPRSIAWHPFNQKTFNEASERVVAVIARALRCP